MTYRFVAATVLLLVSPVLALDGQPPSTIRRPWSSTTGSSTPTGPVAACRSLVSDDGWTWRRAGTLMQALPGGRPGPDVIARGGNNTWAPDVIRVGDRYLRLLLRAGHAAEVGHRPAGRQDARSGVARLQVGRRAARSSGPTASRTATPSTPACSAIRRTARSGSPTGPTSATSASSSWIRRPGSVCIPSESRSTSPSTPKRRS